MLDLNRIYNMDCLKGLQGLDSCSVDLILTDPPYGINYQSVWRTDKAERFDFIKNDGQPFVWFLYDSFRVLKEGGSIICFCRWDVQEDFIKAMRWAGFKVKSQIIWDRQVHGLGDLKAQFAPQHDVILFGIKGKFEFKNGRPKSVVSVARVPADKLVHPTEKPLDLMYYFVEKLSNKGDLVLDPFMGSGVTAIASKKGHRNFIGFELSKEYVDLANKRLSDVQVELHTEVSL